MSHSKPLAAACLGLLLAPAASADELKLDQGRVRLSGEILAIGKDGVIDLASPLSTKPLRLKSSALDEARFTTPGDAPKALPILLQLRNGDKLPADRVIDMDERQLQTDSHITGPLSVPRASLDSAQFGVTDDEDIGAEVHLDEWLDEENEQRNWEYKGRALVANGTARASHQFKLPTNFVISFKLAWNERNPPSFRLLFARDSTNREAANDQYRFSFNNSGLHLERESTRTKELHTLTQLRRLPTQYPRNEVSVEIRVHRENRRLELLIDGEPEASCIDPIDRIPQGSVVTIECNSSNGSIQKISDFSIIELTRTHARHLSEARGDGSSDILITRDDDRLAGQLLDIRPSPDGNILRFRSSFVTQPLEIPESEVSTILFAQADTDTPAPGAPFRIKLRNQGELQVGQPELAKDRITTRHPLLGPLEIRKGSVESIGRTKPE